MSLITVIGIGNRLFCDDAIGNIIVEALLENKTDGCISYIVGETDIAYCLSQIQSQYVVIVDAVQMGSAAGSIHVMPINEVMLSSKKGISMHNQHLIQLLDQLPISIAFIIGIEPYKLSTGWGLSEPMRQNFDSILYACRKIIENFMHLLIE